jgi:cytochrome c-type biogenesis protein CcmH/NrfF
MSNRRETPRWLLWAIVIVLPLLGYVVLVVISNGHREMERRRALERQEGIE